MSIAADQVLYAQHRQEEDSCSEGNFQPCIHELLGRARGMRSRSRSGFRVGRRGLIKPRRHSDASGSGGAQRNGRDLGDVCWRWQFELASSPSDEVKAASWCAGNVKKLGCATAILAAWLLGCRAWRFATPCFVKLNTRPPLGHSPSCSVWLHPRASAPPTFGECQTFPRFATPGRWGGRLCKLLFDLPEWVISTTMHAQDVGNSTITANRMTTYSPRLAEGVESKLSVISRRNLCPSALHTRRTTEAMTGDMEMGHPARHTQRQLSGGRRRSVLLTGRTSFVSD